MTTALSLNWWVSRSARAGPPCCSVSLRCSGPAWPSARWCSCSESTLCSTASSLCITGIRAAEHHERWWPALLEAVARRGRGCSLVELVPAATVVGLLYGRRGVGPQLGRVEAGGRHPSVGRHVPGAWWLAVAGLVSLSISECCSSWRRGLVCSPSRGGSGSMRSCGGATCLRSHFGYGCRRHGHRPGAWASRSQSPGGRASSSPIRRAS